MRRFEYIPCKSYDKTFSLNYKRIGCYSIKALHRVHRGDINIVGEVYHDNSKDKECDIGVITLADKTYRVRRTGTFDNKKFKHDRVIKVGEDEFLTVVRNKAFYEYWSYAAIVIGFILFLVILFKPD